jgi:hypothetical protein
VALLGGLGVIAVFTTGLVLDLLGSSYFRVVEMRIFVRHTRQHIHWFQRVADLNSAYIQEDCSLLLNTIPFVSQFRESLKLSLFLTTGNEWDWVVLLRRGWQARRAYTRMQSLLLSYVLLTSGVDKLEMLSTQMSLWNSGRAIATALVISSIEVGVFLWFVLNVGAMGAIQIAIIMASQLFLSVLGFSVATSAYERVCSTLFALVYVISEREVR